MLSIGLLQQVSELTQIDLGNKSVSEMFFSMIEELGEFSKEVKIEDGVFGNKHKKAGEDGSKGEAIDVIIMALALYFARGGEAGDLQEGIQRKLDKWRKNQK